MKLHAWQTGLLLHTDRAEIHIAINHFIVKLIVEIDIKR